jgi:hypothetical protein
LARKRLHDTFMGTWHRDKADDSRVNKEYLERSKTWGTKVLNLEGAIAGTKNNLNLNLGKLSMQRRMSGRLPTLQVWVVLNLFIQLGGLSMASFLWRWTISKHLSNIFLSLKVDIF